MSDENEGIAGSPEKTGNVVKNTKFKSEGDWINRLLTSHCTSVTGAVEEVKDDEGEVTTPAKKGKETLDVDALLALAAENGIEVKRTYPNPGMYRMNIGNMLRGIARKAGGLRINGEDVPAPEDFTVNEKLTHEIGGAKKAAAAKVEDAATDAEAGADAEQETA